MQYLLSKEEYDKLTTDQLARSEQHRAALQDLCTKVADHMPTRKPYGWKEGEPLIPYGCIRTTRNEYCDTCPVKDVCPNQFKSWSQ